MGPVSGIGKCQTCSGDDKQSECVGHFGFIKLAEPVYHYGYMEIVQKILSCVCYKCSGLLLPKVRRREREGKGKKNDKEYERISNIKDPTRRLRELYNECKKTARRKCDPEKDETEVKKKRKV